MGILDFLKGNNAESAPNNNKGVLDTLNGGHNGHLKDTIAPAAIGIESRGLMLGGLRTRSFFIMSFPRFLNDNWFSPIINLDKVFDIGIHITPQDTTKVMNELQHKVAEVESQIILKEEKGQTRDPQLETAFNDIEDLRDSLMQAEEKMYDVGIYITIYGNDDNELDKVENEIKNILESKLIQFRPTLFQEAEGLMSSIPLGLDQVNQVTRLNTTPLSSVFPFVSFDLTSNKGIMYGVNRHNGSLVIFDRFSLENYNSIIFAKSGSGKSYTTKLEILRTLMFDTEVIIIDPEREYEYLTEAVGGRYFDISLTSSHHINPFDLPPIGRDENPSDVLRSNIINLVGLFRVMLGGISAEEDAIIDQAITETYALKDITPGSDFSQIFPPTLSDFEAVLRGIEGTENLVEKLSKYTTGSWAGFLNHPTNVDIDKKCISFSIRDMEDELKPVAMYLITHYIWNSVRKNIRRRLLVVDEAWIMMKSDDTASFLFGLAKRGRKYYLGLCTITQDVNDFLRNQYGLPIITNSSIQLLLKQSPTSIDAVQDAFNLTDEEKYLLLECNVGEGIFFAGQKHVAIKIIASYTEDQIITSDPAQIAKINESKTK